MNTAKNSRAKGRNWMGTLNNPEGSAELFLKNMHSNNGKVQYIKG